MKALLVCSIVCLAVFGAVIATSEFNSGAEGWQVVALNIDGPYDVSSLTAPPQFRRSGGSPGGYIHTGELERDDNYFSAPAPFLGNQGAAYGGRLRFRLKLEHAGGEFFDTVDVILAGAGMVLVYDLPDNPGTSWTPFEVALHETAGWRRGTLAGRAPTAAEFKRVLSSLRLLRIRAEYVDGHDAGSLDSVFLESGDAVTTESMPPRVERAELAADLLLMEGGQVRETARYYLAPGKIRQESALPGGNITIVRKDRGVAWVLHPSRQQYRERPFDARYLGLDLSGDPPGLIRKESVGRATVAGYTCTKYRLTVAGPRGREVAATAWYAEALGMAVRMEVSGITSELRNIRFGRQPAHLFTIPAGYQPVSAAGHVAQNVREAEISLTEKLWRTIEQYGGSSGLPSWLPLMDGCTPRPSVARQVGTMSMLCTASPEEVAEFYEFEMNQSGFRMRRNPTATVAGRGTVSMRSTEGNPRVSILINRNLRGQTAAQFDWGPTR